MFLQSSARYPTFRACLQTVAPGVRRASTLSVLRESPRETTNPELWARSCKMDRELAVQMQNMKGRLNFMQSPAGSLGPSHIITLVDSDPAKTLADAIHRPSNDDKDTYIGLDVPAGGASLSQSQLAFGAPVSVSNYIGNKGDGARWKERLTASEKTFAVPVAIQKGNTLTVGEGSP